MKNNGNPKSISKNAASVQEKILSKCDKLETKEEKLSYLKKVENDCQRIINLGKKIGGKYLDINFLLKEEPDIDEYLIMLLDGLCEPAKRLSKENTGDNTSKQRKIPSVVRAPRKYYEVKVTAGDRACDIKIAFGDVERVKENINDEMTVVKAVDDKEEDTYIPKGERIKLTSSITDIVRIFEAMKAANIIDNRTPVKAIAHLFYSEENDIKDFEKKYNAIKYRIKRDESASNSEELLEFIKRLIDECFKGKDAEIEKLIKHLEKLQNLWI